MGPGKPQGLKVSVIITGLALHPKSAQTVPELCAAKSAAALKSSTPPSRRKLVTAALRGKEQRWGKSTGLREGRETRQRLL